MHCKYVVFMEDDLNVLTDQEISTKLKDYPGWTYRNNKISKEFVFENFSQVVEFINTMTPLFNKMDHHPDIHIYYKKVVFELQRFSVGGKVTERDFTVAREIESLYTQRDDRHNV